MWYLGNVSIWFSLFSCVMSVRCRRLELGLAVKLNDPITLTRVLAELGSNDDALRAIHRGRSLLSEAVGAGHLQIVRLLLEHAECLAAAPALQGCQTGGQQWEPPLVTATRHQPVAMSRVLLEHGADPDSADSCGHTPLWTAVWGRRQELVHVLVNEGRARLSCPGQWAACSVHLTAREPARARVSIAVQLVRFGAHCHCRDRQGRSALHWAELHAKNSSDTTRSDAARQLKLALQVTSAPGQIGGVSSLRHLCRLLVRKSLLANHDYSLVPVIKQLNLPNTLNRILLLEEELETLEQWRYERLADLG